MAQQARAAAQIKAPGAGPGLGSAGKSDRSEGEAQAGGRRDVGSVEEAAREAAGDLRKYHAAIDVETLKRAPVEQGGLGVFMAGAIAVRRALKLFEPCRGGGLGGVRQTGGGVCRLGQADRIEVILLGEIISAGDVEVGPDRIGRAQ